MSPACSQNDIYPIFLVVNGIKITRSVRKHRFLDSRPREIRDNCLHKFHSAARLGTHNAHIHIYYCIILLTVYYRGATRFLRAYGNSRAARDAIIDVSREGNLSNFPAIISQTRTVMETPGSVKGRPARLTVSRISEPAGIFAPRVSGRID